MLSSFGLDAFDSLYWQTRHRPEWRPVLTSFAIVAVYVIVHSFLFFTQVATLTVATNSTDHSMITVMILNNFTEIKGSVFKKFDKHNLFQLACSDITERFHLCLFMMLIMLVGLAQAGSTFLEIVPSFIRIILTMIACEAFADWIKHAFIVKINQLEPTLYSDYAKVLRADVLNHQKDRIVLERTYGIARRLGFPQIPLACVCIRYINLMLSTPFLSNVIQKLRWRDIFGISGIVFLLLLFIKVIIGISLIAHAAKAQSIQNDEELDSDHSKDSQTKGDSTNQDYEREEREVSLLRLSDIERYSVWKGRIVG